MRKILYILIMCTMCACHTSKVAENESVYIYRCDTITQYIDKVIHDSIHVQDSIFQNYKIGNIIDDVRVDTLFSYKYKIKYIYKYVEKKDSTKQTSNIKEKKSNTIVVKKESWWNRVIDKWSKYAFVALLLIIICAKIKNIIRL